MLVATDSEEIAAAVSIAVTKGLYSVLLGDTTLTAPFPGVVVARRVERGGIGYQRKIKGIEPAQQVLLINLPARE